MPNMHSAMTRMKPIRPPVIVNSVLRPPCSAPCVKASRPLGPGVREIPMLVTKNSSQVLSAILIPLETRSTDPRPVSPPDADDGSLARGQEIRVRCCRSRLFHRHRLGE